MDGLYIEKLDFQNEYRFEELFQTKPLVIIKDKPSDITNDIGSFFRKYNIMEYKSPNDIFNIDTFYKIQAYAAFYKSDGDTVDERKFDDITISIVTEQKPIEFFKTLEGKQTDIEMPYNGIYYIKNIAMFPAQVIVIDELSDEHVWIKSLSHKMDITDMKKLLDEAQKLKNRHEIKLANSLIDAVLKENKPLIEEIRRDKELCKLLMELSEEAAEKYL